MNEEPIHITDEQLAMVADGLEINRLWLENSRLRSCLKRLIEAHNNDADMDIYDSLIIEASAALKEGE